jgi:glucosamine--fructose-6-phosphate aminotransferase (isomerizing)
MLVGGLRRMEYRGYDSAGVATLFSDQILVKKSIGKVDEVNKAVHLDVLPGNVGIGHTRWATHGGVTNENAHPHLSSSGKVVIVHNGIIDNHRELRERLMESGSVFKSETDSEVIAELLERNYNRTGDIRDAVVQSVSELKGSYAFVAMFEDGTLVAVRFHQPLIIGLSEEGYFVASDILGFVEHTDKAIFLEDRDIVIISKAGMFVGNFDRAYATHQIVKLSNNVGDMGRGDYAHHTLKEIFEQPMTVRRAGRETEREMTEALELVRRAKRVYITGSGTSFHAALMAKHLFSKHSGLTIEPIIASEARFSPNHFGRGSVLIAVSQSGESADVLEAVTWAKERGSQIISIVNVMTSSLVRMSSISLGLNCGPEIGVAATKSFSSQLATLYEMADRLCGGCIGLDFNEASEQITKALRNHQKIKGVASKLRDVSDMYVAGRGIHYFVAAEGALKLKELSYIHAEAILAGELKHGPMALLDSDYYVIVINPYDSTYYDTLLGAREAKARGAKIVGISDKDSDVYDEWIEIPNVRHDLYPFIELVPLQLLAYYLALERDIDPDYPRNLAKSVTVR